MLRNALLIRHYFGDRDSLFIFCAYLVKSRLLIKIFFKKFDTFTVYVFGMCACLDDGVFTGV